jgi:hypothetical protein
MTISYIDLSDRHGHRNDHGFSCGAEFNVKTRRRIDIPDFVREQLSASEIDYIWRDEAERSRDDLAETLRRRYKWIGSLVFVGRGLGWLAIEDTGCKTRNWDSIGKIVEKRLKEFIKSMEDPAVWRDVRDIAPEGIRAKKAPTRQHSTRKPVARATITQAVASLGPHYAKPSMLKEMGWSQREIEAAVRRGDLAWRRDGGLKAGPK